MAVSSVDEIINLSESFSNPNRMAYKHLKKQLDAQIRERAVRHNSVSFRTPSIMFGKPAFDRAAVQKRLIRHYSRIGFACYREPGAEDVVIRWKEEKKKKKKKDRASSGPNPAPGPNPDADSDSDSGSDSGSGSSSSSGSDAESGSGSGSASEEQDQDQDPDGEGSDGDTNTTKRVVIEEPGLFCRRLDRIN